MEIFAHRLEVAVLCSSSGCRFADSEGGASHNACGFARVNDTQMSFTLSDWTIDFKPSLVLTHNSFGFP